MTTVHSEQGCYAVTQDAVAEIIADGGLPRLHRAEAEKVLAYLAGAGRLLPEGGERIELFAAFRNQHAATHAPWVDHADYAIRSNAEAALHTARVWGGEAIAARCVQTWWPNGREYRTPWERIDG